MRILAVNNTVMFEHNDGFFVFKETGKFFQELNRTHDVTVFQISMLMGPGDSFASYNLRAAGLRVVNVKRRSSRIMAYIKAFFVGLNEVRKADFVYLFFPGPICSFLAMCSIVIGKRFGLYLRGEQNIGSELSRYIYSKAAVVYTISPKFTEIIKSFGGNAFTIRPMLDIDEKYMVNSKVYEDKAFYKFLYVGRIVKDKGLFELIEAVALLNNLGVSNFELDLIGDGPEVENLKNKISNSSLISEINFRGMISDKETLSRYYGAADLFILPTYHEGFPRVLYEAMIFGVPIITTMVGTIPYLLRNNVDCFEVSPKSVDDLVKIIQDILSNYSVRVTNVGKNASQTILTYLSDKKEKHPEQLNNFLQCLDRK